LSLAARASVPPGKRHSHLVRGFFKIMMEVELSLGFACCICDHPVSVTVKCSGQGLAAGGRPLAAVNVPCPHCGLVNQLSFEPNGTVRSVAPYVSPYPVPLPSVN
jgi:hypothetical protein